MEEDIIMLTIHKEFGSTTQIHQASFDHIKF